MNHDIVAFMNALLTLKSKHAFSVTSWWRTPKRNTAVGGSANSLHMLGLAVDTVLDNMDDRVVFVADATRLGCEAIYEGDHIHLEWDHK
jgi:uncharacterized protein YcbK (DUF882 family)